MDSPKIDGVSQVPYSQHFIFFVTYAWAQARGLDYNARPEWFASYEHSNLLGTRKL